MIFIKYLIFHFNTSMAQKVESFFFFLNKAANLFLNSFLKINISRYLILISLF